MFRVVIKYIVCRVCLEWLLSTLFVECVRVVNKLTLHMLSGYIIYFKITIPDTLSCSSG